MLICPRTRAAAVIDPPAGCRPELAALLEQHALKLRFVLRTQDNLAAPASRYRSMLSSLGLSENGADSKASSPTSETFVDLHKPAAVTVGPAPARQDSRSASEAVLLQVADGTVGVRLFDGTRALAPRFTVGGSLLGGQPPTAHICGSARVALGAFFVEVLPIEPGHVAYHTQDRLFTGTAPGRTPPVLFSLGDDVIVHPSVLEGTTGISSIAQERRSDPGHSASKTPEALSWPGSMPTSTS